MTEQFCYLSMNSLLLRCRAVQTVLEAHFHSFAAIVTRLVRTFDIL